MSGTDELNRSVYETRTETDYTLDEEEQTDGTDRIVIGALNILYFFIFYLINRKVAY